MLLRIQKLIAITKPFLSLPCHQAISHHLQYSYLNGDRMSIDILLCVSQTWSERSGLPPKSHFTRPPSYSGRQRFYGGKICLHSVRLRKALLTYTYTRFVLIFKCSASHCFFFNFLVSAWRTYFSILFVPCVDSVAKEFSQLVTVLFTYGTEPLKITELNFIKANHCLFRLIVDNLRVYKSRKALSNYISKSNVSPGLAL